MFTDAVFIFDSQLSDYQQLRFNSPKPIVSQGKIILKIQLIENKEVTLLVELNW